VNRNEGSLDLRWDPISLYLMAAYAYYKDDDPIMADFMFDDLAKHLLETIDSLPAHPHKHLLTKDDLRAGTYLGEYPEIVIGALEQYKRKVLSLS
jgi:hypothetical protein